MVQPFDSEYASSVVGAPSSVRPSEEHLMFDHRQGGGFPPDSFPSSVASDMSTSVIPPGTDSACIPLPTGQHQVVGIGVGIPGGAVDLSARKTGSLHPIDAAMPTFGVGPMTAIDTKVGPSDGDSGEGQLPPGAGNMEGVLQPQRALAHDLEHRDSRDVSITNPASSGVKESAADNHPPAAAPSASVASLGLFPLGGENPITGKRTHAACTHAYLHVCLSSPPPSGAHRSHIIIIG